MGNMSLNVFRMHRRNKCDRVIWLGYAIWSNGDISGVEGLLGLYVIIRSGTLDDLRLSMHS